MSVIDQIKNLNPFRNPLNLRKITQPRTWNWRRIRRWVLRIVLGFFLFVLLLFAWFAKDLPTPGKIKNLQTAGSIQLFDRNDEPIYTVSGGIKRFDLNSTDIPDVVKQTTLTAEDRNFYHEFAINIKGVMRAAYYDIFHKTAFLSGGSTITQQFVKNALLSPQKTFTRKIKELILSIEIEIMYSKNEILTMYLNQIPYGSNAYGVEAASQTFFDKHAKDLDLAEAATLAAMLQRPTYYSPYGSHPNERLARVNWIIDSMVSLKYIDQAQADKAKAEAKNLKFAERHDYVVAPHFAEYVKSVLVEKYGEQMVESSGLKVTTTLDLDKQVMAEDAVKSGADRRFDNINASNAALVSIDPKTGQILAMVGSKDYFDNSIDGQVNVAVAERQPGSAFKPVVYATAFKQNYDPAFTLWDVQTDFGNYTPRNYDGTFHGPVSMRKALAGSLNIPAVKTLYLAGLDNVLNQAHSMGITTLNDRDRYGLSLVLGGGEIKLVDLATAYGVFANNGALVPTTPILKVVDGSGKVLEAYKDNKKEVLSPDIAYEVSSILSDNQARSFIFGSNSALYFDDRPVAAKTGTTSEYRDAWTFGYTPSLVTGVWVGNNDNSPMTAGAAGAMAAAPIWHDFMAKALANTPVEDFQKPDGIQSLTVDKYTNKLPAGGEIITDIFTSWQVPTERAHGVGTIRIDKYTGQEATDDCPSQFVEEKTYMDIHSELPENPNWENPVRAYAASMGIISTAPPSGTKTCAGLTNKTTVKITAPANNKTINGSFTIVASVESAVGIKSVEFLIDDKSIGTDTNKPYSMISNTATLSTGTHRVSAVVTDVTGLSYSDSVVINTKSKTSPSPIPSPATSL